MLTKAEAKSLHAGDVLDIQIIDDQATMGHQVQEGLRGRIIRVVFEKVDMRLVSGGELDERRDGGSAMASPIARTIDCHALSGDNMPDHILRVEPPEGHQAMHMGLPDWMVDSIHLVARG